jgi:predicted dehydrogenase
VPVALIGCGWAGQRHARALAARGAALRWAVDRDPGRAQRLAGAHPGCRATTDYREPLQDAAVVAVDLCLPHDLHGPGADAGARPNEG